jgi:NAD(P)-dependent dehydrogenase (short-subunit alcohol dehydrogenase family)
MELLVRQGFRVFACDIDGAALKKLGSENIIPLIMDISSRESIKQMLAIIERNTNQLHGLVNIAGRFDQFALVEAKEGAFEALLDVNLYGPQQLTSLLFPLLLNAKGRIINLSSETVLAQMPVQVYGLSKKLFDVWNSQLRMELKLIDMEVIVIRAGGHQTPFIEKSKEIIGITDPSSIYSSLYKRIKEHGIKILSKKQHEPLDVAKVIYKALTIKNPKHVYNVNVSSLFKLLSMLPERLREEMILNQLKKWM